MELIEKIIALLEGKFQGVRKDVIQSLAGAIALQVEDENGAKTIVDQMTADKVTNYGKSLRSRIDAEVQQSNQKFEQNLRSKYDFKEKGNPDPNPGGALTLDAIKQLMAETLNPLAARMDAFEGQKAAQARRETYVAKLNEAKLGEATKEMLLANFDRMSFKDDAEFGAFMTSNEPTLKKLAQESQDASLRGNRVPSFGSTNNEGVSQGVAAYIAAKEKKEGQELGGKSL